VPPRAITAEPFDAIAQMAERLADQASGSTNHLADFAPIWKSQSSSAFACTTSSATVECGSVTTESCFATFWGSRERVRRSARTPSRPHAARLHRSGPGPVPRAALDDERSQLLEQVKDGELNAMTRSRLHARRAGVWASLAYAHDRRGEPAGTARRVRLRSFLPCIRDLGEDRRPEYVDAVLRVSAIRWAGALMAPQVDH